MMRVDDVYGCDIGNGFGYISLLENANSDPKPMFLTNATYQLDMIGMPTSAYISPPDGKKIEVFDGRSACNKHRRESDKFIHAVKTRLKEGKIPVPGISKAVSTDAIYAAIARDLVKQGNERRKADNKDCIYRIAFAYPAAFTGDVSLINRMKKSIEGISVDGKKIQVIASLPEPAAVAIDYLYYLQNFATENIQQTGENFTALIYDLGHGTFDAAVVTARSKGEPYRLHFSDGIPDVGGQDFDDILYLEIINNLKVRYGYAPQNNNEKENIRNEAIKIKHELTNDDISSCSISLPNGEYAEIEISKKTFEEKSKHLIMQTMLKVSDMLEKAKTDSIHIDAIVLSGGASQMPMVIDNLRLVLEGDPIPIESHRPSKAVSFGAARYGYWESARIKEKEEEDRKRRTEEERKRKEKEEVKGREGHSLAEESKKVVKAQGISQKENTVPKIEGQEKGLVKTKYIGKATQGKKTNSILEKYTEYSYGIWLPSSDSIIGKIEFLIRSREKIPAVSEGVSLISSSGRTVIKVYRTSVKYDTGNFDSMDDCVEILRIPFEIPENREYELKMTVLDDYNIVISCAIDGGNTIEKSTSDLLGDLIV